MRSQFLIEKILMPTIKLNKLYDFLFYNFFLGIVHRLCAFLPTLNDRSSITDSTNTIIFSIIYIAASEASVQQTFSFINAPHFSSER